MMSAMHVCPANRVLVHGAIFMHGLVGRSHRLIVSYSRVVSLMKMVGSRPQPTCREAAVLWYFWSLLTQARCMSAGGFASVRADPQLARALSVGAMEHDVHPQCAGLPSHTSRASRLHPKTNPINALPGASTSRSGHRRHRSTNARYLEQACPGRPSPSTGSQAAASNDACPCTSRSRVAHPYFPFHWRSEVAATATSATAAAHRP